MIQIDELNFNYPKQGLLFDKLSLSLEDGSITGLLGKNGAGKSTLLKLMSGLLTPQNGTINISGYTPHHRLPAFLQDIFLVPEELYFPNGSTIRSYIKLLGPLYPRFDFKKVTRIIQEFELDNNKSLEKMSYGQKKKFIIAFALATQCKILVLDEPTNGLDIPSKLLFKKIVASEINEEQIVIISTHQVKDVENLIDKVVIVESGSIILNKDIYALANNYAVKMTSTPDAYDYLYKEMAPGGHKILTAAKGETNDVDLEILFNAAINGVNLS
ncbi:MAG: ABC transporter ATP-binding protein [Bacteroidales bacterium]|jgi:ABC-2 type transport system ATP-binding protein|nr:ABC transporter ATP-binding protein [Bacteroidales bacterium]